jgi:hypothetical protein
VLVEDPVVPESHRFALDDEGQAGLGGAAARLLVEPAEPRAFGRIAHAVETPGEVRGVGEGLLQPLPGPAERGRLLGDDLALDAPDALARVAAQPSSSASRARASA